MRRTLRKTGPRTQALVKAVEDEIVGWLSEGGVVLQPDGTLAAGFEGLQFPGRVIGEQQGVREVERSQCGGRWVDMIVRYPSRFELLFDLGVRNPSAVVSLLVKI